MYKLKILSEFTQTNSAFGSVIPIVGKKIQGLFKDLEGISRSFQGWMVPKDFSKTLPKLQRLCKPCKNKMTKKKYVLF